MLLPFQANKAASWRARAKEKVTGHGYGPASVIACRLAVACSMLCPPLKKTTPARVSGTCLRRTEAVACPTSAGVDWTSYCLPAKIMLTFRMQAERSTE